VALSPTDRAARDRAAATLRRIADLDTGIARALDEVGPPLIKTEPPGFASLFRIIVAQHVSTASAAAVWARLEAAGADDPDRLTALSDDRLGTLGLTRAKQRAVRALADAVIAGRLDPVAIGERPGGEIEAALTALPGIGRWTSDIYRLFALGDPDVFPAGDVAIREGIRLMDQLPERPDARACDRRAEPWRPERSAVTHLLWRLYCARTGRRVLGVTDDLF